MNKYDYRRKGNLCFIFALCGVILLLAGVGIYLTWVFKDRGISFLASAVIAGLALESIFVRELIKRSLRFNFESLEINPEAFIFRDRSGAVRVKWEEINRLSYLKPIGSNQEYLIECRKYAKPVIFDSSIRDYEELIALIEKKAGKKFAQHHS